MPLLSVLLHLLYERSLSFYLCLARESTYLVAILVHAEMTFSCLVVVGAKTRALIKVLIDVSLV